MQLKALTVRSCAFITAAASVAAAPILADAASDQGAPMTPSCAWETEWSADNHNTYFPDSASHLWIMPFTVQDGLQIALDGQYPDSRYASINVYKPGGGSFTENGVNSSLTDYQIEPKPGSVNPWRHDVPAGGNFTVTLRSDVAPGQANTLPLAPAGTEDGATGNIVYRVYVPVGGDFSRIPLPAVTFTLNGVSQQIPECPRTGASLTKSVTTTDVDIMLNAAGASIEFARVGGGSSNSSGSGFPNPDSAYVGARAKPAENSDDVIVIRGKAPRASSGAHPSPWPAAGKDIRYWSMCTNLTTAELPVVVNHLPDGTVDYGCRYDDETTLDRDGFYTYVVGTESQRDVIQQLQGVTFLPFSTTQPTAEHALLLRNMLVDPDFVEAIQNVPTSQDPAAAAEVMGPYYPHAAFCPLATIASEGAEACFSGD